MNDGPQGFRINAHPGTSTAFPSGLTMAASWDEEAVLEWGKGMGKEFYQKGANVQLGPGICIARVPRNGRNFEYLAGEDPYLGYVLAKASVQGIQSQKVVANAKHWALNSQETARQSVSEGADERTRFEIYYPPFAGAIEAGVGSFMCSYNKINGAWSCENPETLGELKKTMGFTGYVMSDWGATHSPSLAQGLDMEMPAADFLNAEFLKPALAAGTVTQSALDDTLVRIFRPMFEVGVMDEPTSVWDWKKLGNNVTSEASVAAARRLSALSTVLLKNDGGVLPLPRGKRLALLGFAAGNAVVHGGGSGSVVASYVAHPLEGISAVAGAEVEFNDGQDIAAAASLAASADYAVVFVGTLSSEGSDRVSLSLDDGCDKDAQGQCGGNAHSQNALIEAVAKANSKTIVVASVPGAVLMPWADSVPAILTNFMPGQQAGHAIADVLFGKVNPSARLPLTFPRAENETQLSPQQWPGVPNPSNPAFNFYTERLLVGYRFYDAHGLQPRFAFGHGLSYTSFAYSGLKVSTSTVSFTVKNVGTVPGSEVAQLYLGFPEAAGEPPLQLKGFKKTRALGPGQEQEVELKLLPRDLSIWDAGAHAWSLVHGSFKVMVGASSRDIRLRGELTVKGETYV
eukprot:CAMPEP_0204586102 /NCGR_PEP_ID=MMETSP0661-20131031/47296_1 /ASSEMBLY_ACC=CAM_ASM_000606 /TAXON_ID=109239 /ORGANISM="Alexandrium margalefi, Strain AMGDE01CS-322" /LENGTH=628 /DNA_ID=CAMNT_0051595715 /DNA_START=27 /DNA_END=1913 /DNA_ORIENTATION=-